MRLSRLATGNMVFSHDKILQRKIDWIISLIANEIVKGLKFTFKMTHAHLL